MSGAKKMNRRGAAAAIAVILIVFFAAFLGVRRNAHAHDTSDLMRALAAYSEIDLVYAQSAFLHPDFRKPGSPATRVCERIRTTSGEHFADLVKSIAAVFYKRNKKAFDALTIPPEYVLAIFRHETVFGYCLGDHYVLGRLYDVYAYATDEKTRNYALNQIAALFESAAREKWTLEELLDIPGSYMGAFGMSQFIPQSYRDYAIDGDGDGRIDLLNNPHDAIPSTENHLIRWGGWYREPGAPEPRNYRKDRASYAVWCANVIKDYPDVRIGTALFRYNRSCNYVRRLFEFSEMIRRDILRTP